MTNTPPLACEGYTFYATLEYFEQLTRDIDATVAGDRVLLASMTLDVTTPAVKGVMAALQAAAQRGVKTTINIDANTFLGLHKNIGPLWWDTTLQPPMSSVFKPMYDMLEALKASGVETILTNMPKHRFTAPFVGRSHIKISIINDKIYIGGCNLGLPLLDCMVAWQDNITADWLYDLMCKRTLQPATLAAFGAKDLRHKISPHDEILVDVGVKQQSVIYDEALKVIDDAQEWLIITCQFFPNSRTAKHLKQAYNRGVKVYPVFNHYSSHASPYRLLQHAVTARERLRMPASFFSGELPKGSEFLHAKILATEKEALIGSHNYVPSGVRFGTAEIALHSTSPAFARAAALLILKETGLNMRPEFSFLTD